MDRPLAALAASALVCACGALAAPAKKPPAKKPPAAAHGSLPPGAPAPPKAETRGDPFDQQNNLKIDAAKFQFDITPGKRVLAVGEELSFTARPKTDGYLVVLERDTRGKVVILYPESRKPDECKVNAGRIVAIPGENQSFVPAVAGNHWLKAFLFPAREQAEAAIRKPLGLFPDAGARDLVRIKAAQPGYVAHVRFEVKK